MPDRKGSELMYVKTVTLTCPKCACAFVVTVPARWREATGAENRRILCESCRYNGWLGFFYIPFGVLGQLCRALYELLEPVIQELLRKL